MSHIMDNELTEVRYSEIVELIIKDVIEEIDQHYYENDYRPLSKNDKLLVGITISHLADTGRIIIKEPDPIDLHEDDDDSGL